MTRSWFTWSVCVHRHQSQIKEEQMEAEDYNSSMSPETEDQHSPDTNHNPEYSEEPGFSSSPHAFHCWDPRGSVGLSLTPVQRTIRLRKVTAATFPFGNNPFIYCFDIPVSVVCNGLTSLVLKGSSVSEKGRPSAFRGRRGRHVIFGLYIKHYGTWTESNAYLKGKTVSLSTEEKNSHLWVFKLRFI